MSSIDWFRRSTWTDRDRDDFNARLKRSRGASSKAQYLRIQALHLAEAGFQAPAIELLDRLLTEFPQKTELASAHHQRAECLAKLGQADAAIAEFRATFQAERDFPKVRTNAWLDFGWFAVEKERTDLYEEVFRIFSDFREEEGLSFPVLEYRYWAIKAVIAQSRGDTAAARDYASRALAEASKEHSGLRYHPKVGVVTSNVNWMDKKLRALVRA